MAEKRVSVRLSATGGRQVRAELEGIGEAGSRGFGRLSREMELANARMAAFARRARIAATAAAAALTGAVVSMTRSTVAAATLTLTPRLRSASPQFAPLNVSAPQVLLRLTEPVSTRITRADSYRFSVTAREAL